MTSQTSAFRVSVESVSQCLSRFWYAMRRSVKREETAFGPSGLAILLGALLLAGCATSPSDAKESGESPERLRARVARAGDPIERNALLVELSHAELARVRESHTIFGYRRFLQEFPEGEAANTARVLLESLRFEEAGNEDSRQGWESFLANHPDGRQAAEARRRLAAVVVREALASRELDSVRQVLFRYSPPDASATDEERRQWRELIELEDELTWEQARNGDLQLTQAYLAERQDGRFRKEARERRDELIEKQILAEEDLRTARERVASNLATRPQRATAAELELRLALRTLDASALQALVGDPQLDEGGESAKARARAVLESFQQEPLSGDVEEQMRAASRGSGLRGRTELTRSLARGDPRLRAEALIELAEWGDLRDIDTLLEQLDARYVDIRLAAVTALSNLAAAHFAPVWSAQVRERMKALASDGLAVANRRRLAALLESMGDEERALQVWSEVAGLDPEDPTAPARILHLNSSRSDGLATSASAAALLRVSLDFGEYRWPRPPDPDARFGPDEGELLGLPKELTMLRQLCSAIELAETALNVLDPNAAGSATTPASAPWLHGASSTHGLVSQEDRRTLALFKAKQEELEATVNRRSPGSPPCSTAAVPERVAASREVRAKAIEVLGRSGDKRLLPFLHHLQFSPSSQVSAAATGAVEALMAD